MLVKWFGMLSITSSGAAESGNGMVKALGLTIPLPLLGRADEVIE